VHGDLDGCDHRDHILGQLAAADGYPPTGRPGRGAGVKQPGGLAA
jgi:hypothetical protein